MNMKLRNIPFSPPDMTEMEAQEVREAILSGWITTGPRTKKLEREISAFLHTEKTVCLNSATAAMEMVLHLLGVGPGDEVIVPAYTYTATASVTQHVGAKLVMVDSQKDCVEMDYDQLAEAITEKTKVIVPVDLAGIVCDYDRVYEIVEQKKHLFQPSNALQAKIGRIVVAADCAHAFGASRKGKMAGEIADFSSFSFHAVKNFTTAEGGALTWHLHFGDEKVEPTPIPSLKGRETGTDVRTVSGYHGIPYVEGETWNELLYRLSQLFSLHGQNKDALAKTKLGAWEYDIIGPWYKCNMTDIMAALGLVQMERYPQLLARRKEIIKRYDEGLKDLNVKVLNHYGEDFSGSGHLYIVRMLGLTSEQRNEVITKMAERGVACNVHYKPLPMMTAYKALGFDIKDFPNAYHLFENEITLPLHTKLTDEDVEYVIASFKEVLREV
jgi:dTDP-4-amino-4,6-dideoxygalactose transaminase